MKKLAIVPLVALMVLVAAPAAALTAEEAEQLRAANNAHPAECARLRRQLAHYTMMFKRSATLGNELWTERMGQQIMLLQGVQEQRCPADVPVDEMAELMKQLLILGAKAAIAYFTFGAGGFPF